MPRQAINPAIFCRVCGRGAKDLRALDSHGYAYHVGSGKRAWRPPELLDVPQSQAAGVTGSATLPADHRRRMIEDAPAQPPCERQTPKTSGTSEVAPEIADRVLDEKPGTAGAPARAIPKRSDWHNAEILSGLPWITLPASVQQCDEMLDAIAVSLERANLSTKCWTSLRAYVAELRRRLANATVPA